ncbi:MAG: hypothetical protein JSV26_10635 [bacterium]|nr:MAG: hypothetical protein JSV26_10635 [bacterium]
MDVKDDRRANETEEQLLRRLVEIEGGIKRLVDLVEEVQTSLEGAVKQHVRVQKRRLIEASLFYLFILLFLGFSGFVGMKIFEVIVR